jgi:hypothetical protein
MKKIILASLIMFVLLSGCAWKQPSVCQGLAPEDSVICLYIPNPNREAMILEAGTILAVQKGWVTAEQVQKVTGELRKALARDGVTAQEFRHFVMKAIPDDYKLYFHVAQKNLDLFKDVVFPITEKDKAMLFYQLAEIDMLAEMASVRN